MQFLVLVFLKRHTPPLLLVLLNYMRLFRLLRLMRFLKVCNITCTAGLQQNNLADHCMYLTSSQSLQ